MPFTLIALLEPSLPIKVILILKDPPKSLLPQSLAQFPQNGLYTTVASM